MEGTICGINASVYDPLLACLHKMHGARKSRTLARTGSTLSITKTMKYRPCYILKVNPMANFTTVCFMATFGGADYDDLADITQRLVRPVQHNHPSFSEAATIHLTPAWPREPQWMICWATDVASALSLWSGAGDVPYSTDAATVHKLQRDVWNLEIKLMKAASADCNLARRLQADLMVHIGCLVLFG
ncbi:hypothetical protein CPB85DRAFT_445861 [Mucidula mucida]|nr:hypothetical protein CPB85DRAFT_445861 [Mucidula mucida]